MKRRVPPGSHLADDRPPSAIDAVSPAFAAWLRVAAPQMPNAHMHLKVLLRRQQALPRCPSKALSSYRDGIRAAALRKATQLKVAAVATFVLAGLIPLHPESHSCTLAPEAE